MGWFNYIFSIFFINAIMFLSLQRFVSWEFVLDFWHWNCDRGVICFWFSVVFSSNFHWFIRFSPFFRQMSVVFSLIRVSTDIFRPILSALRRFSVEFSSMEIIYQGGGSVRPTYNLGGRSSGHVWLKLIYIDCLNVERWIGTSNLLSPKK